MNWIELKLIELNWAELIKTLGIFCKNTLDFIIAVTFEIFLKGKAIVNSRHSV